MIWCVCVYVCFPHLTSIKEKKMLNKTKQNEKKKNKLCYDIVDLL